MILQVKERPDIGVYVKDLLPIVVNNADDMDRMMTIGNKNSKKIYNHLKNNIFLTVHIAIYQSVYMTWKC